MVLPVLDAQVDSEELNFGNTREVPRRSLAAEAGPEVPCPYGRADWLMSRRSRIAFG
jgi:hypothetical protein